ncbi:MAG: SDR family oxidoreductase [Alphaproteobacteria bacterium]|nr:SDR family oxidoreductase [Alphaproteobacteria bacterium]
MANLFCFGLGYSATHYVARYGARFLRVTGTVRTAEKAVSLPASRVAKAYVFDGTTGSREIAAEVRAAQAVLVSVPPAEGDPVLRHFADAIASAPYLSSIVYLSTIGVYGDHDGGWVDETTPPAPSSERSRARLAAERAWSALGSRAEKAVAILRLAGIYGPGQNALVQVRRGTARRVIKPGQYFNRIHVTDIAQAIDAAIHKRANGIFNVTDNLPTAPGAPLAYAATLLKLPPPPELAFEEAAKGMSPMALSFYGESKRVRNDCLAALGITLRYPTFREGLGALAESGEGKA